MLFAEILYCSGFRYLKNLKVTKGYALGEGEGKPIEGIDKGVRYVKERDILGRSLGTIHLCTKVRE